MNIRLIEFIEKTDKEVRDHIGFRLPISIEYSGEGVDDSMNYFAPVDRREWVLKTETHDASDWGDCGNIINLSVKIVIGTKKRKTASMMQNRVVTEVLNRNEDIVGIKFTKNKVTLHTGDHIVYDIGLTESELKLLLKTLRKTREECERAGY